MVMLARKKETVVVAFATSSATLPSAPENSSTRDETTEKFKVTQTNNLILLDSSTVRASAIGKHQIIHPLGAPGKLATSMSGAETVSVRSARFILRS
jgi:hypothetical protein